MLFLDVPFQEKDEAKALGAKWNAEKKKWYVPDEIDDKLFAKWTDFKSIKNNSFDRRKLQLENILRKIEENKKFLNAKKKMIVIELVPKTAWCSNLRSELTREEWEQIREKTFKAAGYVCEICGARKTGNFLECHERWEYDSRYRVQKLIKTVSLCSDCHESTHMGLANKNGRYQEARAHLTKVNNWDIATADEHFDKAGDEWIKRNKINWKLDARWLLDFVPVSQATTKKILNYANGLIKRKIVTDF
ncbi:hypothetical protein SPSIL_014220 [Sporomusa silvacetica DSM 10669]|uniref:DUF5710 domain-containing protein n=1 Tax=Sporomusa silvacetica DSM 10669 TaxID=1123289 RepID=A0ABZ3IIW2_9FIRM|nr:DUF5710 domain-containing protein [Sporomusa silvacetica]OZC21485.1 DNA primase TraC [Sporomusa silvacetica DSM 10669]